MPANLENSVVAIGLEKLSFHSNPKKGNAKEWSNYRTIALISQAGKVMLKFFQARLQQYVNMNFQMFKLDLEKAEEPEIKLPTSVVSSKKQEQVATILDSTALVNIYGVSAGVSETPYVKCRIMYMLSYHLFGETRHRIDQISKAVHSSHHPQSPYSNVLNTLPQFSLWNNSCLLTHFSTCQFYLHSLF